MLCGCCDKGDHAYCDRPTSDDYYGKGPCSCQCNIASRVEWRNVSHDDHEGLRIHTLEGTHQATPGDWIIKGVAGEFYPCKPEIFAATYDAVES